MAVKQAGSSSAGEKASLFGGCHVDVRNDASRRARRYRRFRVGGPKRLQHDADPRRSIDTPRVSGSAQSRPTPRRCSRRAAIRPPAGRSRRCRANSPGSSRLMWRRALPGGDAQRAHRLDLSRVGWVRQPRHDQGRRDAERRRRSNPRDNRPCHRDILSRHGPTRAAGAGLPGPGDSAHAGLRVQAEEEIGSLRRRQTKEHGFPSCAGACSLRRTPTGGQAPAGGADRQRDSATVEDGQRALVTASLKYNSSSVALGALRPSGTVL